MKIKKGSAVPTKVVDNKILAVDLDRLKQIRSKVSFDEKEIGHSAEPKTKSKWNHQNFKLSPLSSRCACSEENILSENLLLLLTARRILF